jgi:hypothetical protein
MAPPAPKEKTVAVTGAIQRLTLAAPSADCLHGNWQAGVKTTQKEKPITKGMTVFRRNGLLCAGGAKTAEHLFLPSLFAPLLRQWQKWKT